MDKNNKNLSLHNAILDYLPEKAIRNFKNILNIKLFMYFLKRRRLELLKIRRQKTRELLYIRKKEDKIINTPFIEDSRDQRVITPTNRREVAHFPTKMLIPRSGVIKKPKMLMFRSAIIDDSTNHLEKFNIVSETYCEGLNKVKGLIKFNTDDITNIRHTKKEINGAFTPELVYNTDSIIQISKSELFNLKID